MTNQDRSRSGGGGNGPGSLAQMLGPNAPGGRAWAIGFGLFFSAFALAGLLDGLRKTSALEIAIGVVMIAAGAWIVSIGVVGVPVKPGRFVGGGPLLPRVSLAPDETSVLHDSASYAFGREGEVSALGAFFGELYGELF